MATYPAREFQRKLGGRDAYAPTALMELAETNEGVVREEYRRLREQLRRNVRTIERSEEFPDAQIVKTYTDQFPPASELSGQWLAMKLSQLETVMSAPTSTLTGLRRTRRDIIETLQDRGYTEINKSNYMDFMRFMEATRSLALSILRYRYTKEGVAVGEDRNKRLEMFQIAQEKGISINSLIRDFRFYSGHLDELKLLPDRPAGRKLGIKSIRKRLGR